MSSYTYIGARGYMFGVQKEPKPLKGFPPGKVRIRMRNKEWVVAFVRTSDGIRRFAIIEEGGYWLPGVEIGRNITVEVDAVDFAVKQILRTIEQDRAKIGPEA